MKNLSILALTLSATVAIAPAFAETTSHYNISNPSNQQVDLSFAFDSTENLQVTAMTDKEMAETEGAALPPVAVYYGVVYGVPAVYAGTRWAIGNGPQLLHNRIRNIINK